MRARGVIRTFGCRLWICRVSQATEHRPRSSSRASHTTSSRRADYAPSELSLRGEQGSNDESDRLKAGAPKTKVKRRSLTRPEYSSRDGPRRISRASEQHLPPEMIWENGATPEEAAVLAQKKERRLVREKEKEKEREREREREKERDKERELSRAERREKRLRAKEERAKAREDKNFPYDSQAETVASIVSTWSPDESVIPVLDAVPEPIDFEDEEPAPITAPGPPPPPPPLSSPIQPSPTTKRAEESEKPSSKPAIDITVDPEQNALPKPDAPITKAKAPANELARPKTPEQLQVQELVKTHRHNHSIDSTGSTATLRGNSNESSPTGLDGYRTAATIPDAGSGGSNSSSPPYRSQHEPLPIALPVPAASGWYPPPGPPSDLSARPRTRRPHSFSAAPKPLVGYDRGTVGEDDITPRAKPHYRRASTSNPYPPPYSSGYEYKPPQDPYQPPFYSHSTYPPQPRLDYEVPYQQIPMATSQYTTPAEQRQDPFQYLEGVSEVTQRPSRKSRRRASSTSAGLASDYNEEYSAVEHSLKIPGVEENDTEEAGGVFVTDTPHYQSDDHRSSSSTAYHSLHSHKRSRSVSTTRSSLHSVDDKPNMIPEEDETDNTTEEAAAEPIAAVNPYTWYPQAAPGNDLVPSSMPAPPPSPPPSLPPSVSPAETGYPLLARAVAGNADFQIYRRFATLNHRVLLHMQDEIAEMGLMLEKIDESPDSGVRNRRGMTSTPGGEQRLQLLGAIAWKLECYNKALKAYQETCALPTPPSGAVASYSNFLTSTNPVAEAESQFLEDPDDLVMLCEQPQQQQPQSSTLSFLFPPTVSATPVPPTGAAVTGATTPCPSQPAPAPTQPQPASIGSSTPQLDPTTTTSSASTPSSSTPQSQQRPWYSILPISLPSTPSPLVLTCLLQFFTIIAILLAPHLPSLLAASPEDQCAAAPPARDWWSTVIYKVLLWTLALIPAGVVAGVHVQMMERSARGKDGKGAGGVKAIRSNRWAGAGAVAAAVGLATVMGVLAVSGS